MKNLHTGHPFFYAYLPSFPRNYLHFAIQKLFRLNIWLLFRSLYKESISSITLTSKIPQPSNPFFVTMKQNCPPNHFTLAPIALPSTSDFTEIENMQTSDFLKIKIMELLVFPQLSFSTKESTNKRTIL